MNEDRWPKFLLGMVQPIDGAAFWLIHAERPRFVAACTHADGGVHLVIVLQMDNLREFEGKMPGLMEEAAAFAREFLRVPDTGRVSFVEGLRSVDVPPWLVVHNQREGFFGVLRTQFPFVLLRLDPQAADFRVLEFICANRLTEHKMAQLVLQAKDFVASFKRNNPN